MSSVLLVPSVTKSLQTRFTPKVVSTGICSSLAVNELSRAQTLHLFSLFHVCFVPSDRTSWVKQRVWPLVSRAKHRHCETLPHCVFQNVRFLYIRITMCKEFYETKINRMSVVGIWGIWSFLCEAGVNNDVQAWFVCLFPLRIEQKTRASALESGSQLVGFSSGSWFPYHLDERDCIKTSSDLFKDRHAPVCGQVPLKMPHSNPPPYELFKKRTPGWIYRLPMCINGYWPGHFRVKAPCPGGMLVAN